MCMLVKVHVNACVSEGMCVHACVRACVRSCVTACDRDYVRAGMRASVRASEGVCKLSRELIFTRNGFG